MEVQNFIQNLTKIIKTRHSNFCSSAAIFKLDSWSQDLNAVITLKDCLFGAIKLTKNADPDKYSYSG